MRTGARCLGGEVRHLQGGVGVEGASRDRPAPGDGVVLLEGQGVERGWGGGAGCVSRRGDGGMDQQTVKCT